MKVLEYNPNGLYIHYTLLVLHFYYSCNTHIFPYKTSLLYSFLHKLDIDFLALDVSSPRLLRKKDLVSIFFNVLMLI